MKGIRIVVVIMFAKYGEGIDAKTQEKHLLIVKCTTHHKHSKNANTAAQTESAKVLAQTSVLQDKQDAMVTTNKPVEIMMQMIV